MILVWEYGRRKRDLGQVTAAVRGSRTAVLAVPAMDVGGRFREMLDALGALIAMPYLGLAMSTEFITVVYGRRTSCGMNPMRSSTSTGG